MFYHVLPLFLQFYPRMDQTPEPFYSHQKKLKVHVHLSIQIGHS